MQLRWEDPASHEVREINGNFNTFDLAPTFEAASARYQLAATVAQYAELLRHSPWAQATTLSTLNYYAGRLPASLPEDAEVAEFAQLVGRAMQLRGW